MTRAPGSALKSSLQGEFPGDGRPKAVAFPDPAASSVESDGIRVINLETLVELISAPHRLRDLADVPDLIGVLKLPAGFADTLDPSVRDEYRRLWQAARVGSGGPE